jgi:hypothetical protein
VHDIFVPKISMPHQQSANASLGGTLGNVMLDLSNGPPEGRTPSYKFVAPVRGTE